MLSLETSHPRRLLALLPLTNDDDDLFDECFCTSLTNRNGLDRLH